MAVYWVNYDLIEAGQDYAELITYLKSHDGWAKPLKSSFFVRTSKTAEELCEGIKAHIDSNDKVVVMHVDGCLWAALGIKKEVIDWMHSSI
ncbi:hypothetical protein [Rhodococcus sp. MEB032]|uniref:hypothetical protein n=1 Tax=Rhodococcus sp. MEB032 TaxID=3040322 RepID=UPI00254CB8D0|nr:hypothetical protein [Rhodococcus sp. MEB032]